MENKKVFVSGCFDMLHWGHVNFLKNAAKYGDVYVALGSDKNIRMLKDVKPTYNENEREFILNNLKSVKNAFISPGLGKLHFIDDLKKIQPDIFIVNGDGDSEEKKELCKKMKIDYKVLERESRDGFSDTSSTALRAIKSKLPYRIDLAGGWLDQPHISRLHPGPVITISIEPTKCFNFRSGMATSTRNSAIKLWGENLPEGDPTHLAKILFRYDNKPGTKEIAGSQDSIGMMLPGLNYSYYEDEYWPKDIRTIDDENILKWIEERVCLIPLKEREGSYDVYKNSNQTKENVKELSLAATECFNSMLEMDFENFAKYFTKSFEAQVKLFPATCPEWIFSIIEKYKKEGAKGWKLSGAGGGGYLILVSEIPIKNSIRIKIRR